MKLSSCCLRNSKPNCLRFENVRCSFVSETVLFFEIDIDEELLEILIKILTKYERHEKIIFGDMQNETVSFLNSLTPTNLGR